MHCYLNLGLSTYFLNCFTLFKVCSASSLDGSTINAFGAFGRFCVWTTWALPKLKKRKIIKKNSAIKTNYIPILEFFTRNKLRLFTNDLKPHDSKCSVKGQYYHSFDYEYLHLNIQRLQVNLGILAMQDN